MSRADSPLGGRMIFIVGARRSGTLWLQRIVSAHPLVAAIPSETHLFSHGIAPLFELFQHSLRSSTTTGHVFVERAAAVDAARDLCDAVFGGFLDPGVERLVERTPLHVQHLDLISEIYPDAQYVHIIRDGRDVARSLATQRWGPRELQEAAAEWRSCVLAAREARLPRDRYREVRYETLMEDLSPTIAELYAWLNLPADPELVQAAEAEGRIAANLGADPSGVRAAKWRESYTPAERDAFDVIAGDLIDELEYPRDVRVGAGPANRPAVERLVVAMRRAARLAARGRPRQTGYDQHFVDLFIDALRQRDRIKLGAVMTKDALVRVIAPAGTRSARGEDGLVLLSEVLAELPLEDRETRGDAFPGTPYAGLFLSFEGNGGGSDLTVFMRVRDSQVGELILYPRPR
jgi:hypothetical protein